MAIKMKQNKEELKKEITSQITGLHFRLIFSKSEPRKELIDGVADYILNMIEE